MARKILVVEDDHNISDLIRMYLEKEGFEIQTAFDGGSAVEAFRAWQPDMVLLDLMLPVMDGWAVCGKIRETSRAPIIMITPARMRLRSHIERMLKWRLTLLTNMSLRTTRGQLQEIWRYIPQHNDRP